MNIFYLYLLPLILISSQSTQSTQLLVVERPGSCFPRCRPNYTCVKGRCQKTTSDQCGCDRGHKCQNGFCLPQRCFQCPPNARCAFNPLTTCPQGYRCNKNRTCQNICMIPQCDPGVICPTGPRCAPIGADVKGCDC